MFKKLFQSHFSDQWSINFFEKFLSNSIDTVKIQFTLPAPDDEPSSHGNDECHNANQFYGFTFRRFLTNGGPPPQFFQGENSSSSRSLSDHTFSLQYLQKRAVRITKKSYTSHRERMCTYVVGKPCDIYRLRRNPVVIRVIS